MVNKPAFKEVPVREAVGLVLPHDMTQILPGEFKGRLFKKGHVITEADIEPLLSIGKEHIYILDMQEGWLHENDAAERIAKAVAGTGLVFTEPYEGKVTLKASYMGLVKINAEAIHQLNELEGIALATIETNNVVQAGESVAATRIIPLVMEESRIVELEQLARTFVGSIVELVPFPKRRIGLVTTGSEVYHGRIADKFGPAVRA
ncbi:MAG: molybdopterin-binding protein, partial [Clostridia bacterium]